MLLLTSESPIFSNISFFLLTGTHKQLLKSQRVYAKMWEAQNGEALDCVLEPVVKDMTYTDSDSSLPLMSSTTDSIGPSAAASANPSSQFFPLSSTATSSSSASIEFLLNSAISSSSNSVIGISSVIGVGGGVVGNSGRRSRSVLMKGSREDRLGFIEHNNIRIPLPLEKEEMHIDIRNSLEINNNFGSKEQI